MRRRGHDWPPFRRMHWQLNFMNKRRVNFDQRLRMAVQAFWATRDKAAEKQVAGGRVDQGNRGKVTGGKALDSFRNMIVDVIERNGPKGMIVHRNRTVVGLPGYFRPTKLWDIVVLHGDRLLAVLELKSLCGPQCQQSLRGGVGQRIRFQEGPERGTVWIGSGSVPWLFHPR